MASSRQPGTNALVSTFGGAGQGRDYTSFAVWEAFSDVDCVGTATSYHLDMYDDAVFTEVLQLFGATTNATYYRSFGAAEDEMHDGTPNSGVRFNITSDQYGVRAIEHNVRIHDLVITHAVNRTSTSFAVQVSVGGVIAGCVIKGTNSGTGLGRGIHIQSAATDITIVNTIVYECEFDGIWLDSSGTVRVSNCSLVDNGGVGLKRTDGTVVAKNVLSDGNSAGDFSGTFDASSVTNASGDATAPGTGSRTTQTVTFVDAASDDYHLDTNDTGALGYGTDLSADTFPFDDDIDGQTISTWSIGADSHASEGAYVPGHSYQYYTTGRFYFSFT